MDDRVPLDTGTLFIIVGAVCISFGFLMLSKGMWSGIGLIALGSVCFGFGIASPVETPVTA